jgi:hypothetical protein
VGFSNPGGMTMQILADGYANVNVIVLLKLDIVIHLINFKYINIVSRKLILRNILEIVSSIAEFFLPVIWAEKHCEILAKHFIVERFQSLRVLHGRWQCKGTTQLSECYVYVAICWIFTPLGFTSY